MTETLDLKTLVKRATAQGPGIEDDTSLTTTAAVVAVDAPGRRVRVTVRGGDVWLPAVAGRYSTSSMARVLIDPTSARPVLVIGPVAPRTPYVLALVTAGPTSGNLTVTFDGASVVLPAPMGAYTVGQSAWIALDDWGQPVLVIGPNGAVNTGGTLPGGGGSSGPTTVTAFATIGPQVTGTWRSNVSRWDSWNPNRYGLGATPIYQGNGYGSGPLVGFAGYGDQVVNLGAISIDDITMQAVKGADGNSAALTVQGSPSGGRPGGAPSSAGDTASTGSIGSGGTGALAFTANMRDAFRTGAAKGLAAVGGQYGGFGGFGVPPSFVLQIRYTKNA